MLIVAHPSAGSHSLDMVDLHCHILPGLDDGAETMEDAIAMAEMAIADGITHLVATPHSSSEHTFDYAAVRRLSVELQEVIGHRLKIATGCDFHLNPENLAALRMNPSSFCINQKNYLLVEFNEFSIPPVLDQTLHDLQLAGLHPVVTHPERNSIIRTNPERLGNWVRMGCFVQVTAGSLLGAFGASAKVDGEKWIEQGWIHFVSSDGHNLTSRPPKLNEAFEAVRNSFGTEKANALFSENPLAAFEGRELPHVPQLSDVRVAAKPKRFFFF
ncbi:MAG TPA: CpsB/CapC family capsule biosynthesis tyrosine phosphatase [Candidatus Dormibacteraeota bacterium]|nr:CpsB/CapC family capsule biosynthesis tyrosine phosphatase [Candidatus Dormibacteraeota bacterium]